MADGPYGQTLNVANNNGNPILLPQQCITDLIGWGGANAGNWLRYQLRWDSIEKTFGVYTWNVFDDAVAKCNAGGINMCWNIQSPPPFRTTIDPGTGNLTGTTQTTAAITQGVSITSIAVNALPAGTTLVNASTLTLDATGTNPETVTVNHNGGYAAGATSIAINAFTPAFTHASGAWLVSTKALLPNATDTAAFAGVVAARYNGTAGHGTVQGIQIGNEDWDSYAPRDFQGQLLEPVVVAAYPAIRSAGFTGYIGICAVRKTPRAAITHITNWMNYLWTFNGGMGSVVGADPLFFLDFHYYRGGASAGLDPTTQDADTPSVATELSTIKSIASGFGYTPQVWCGETGWDAYDDGTCENPSTSYVSFATQGQYLVDMFDAMRTGGGSKCFVYTLNPSATVKPLAGCATATIYSTSMKSLTQKINGVYTELPTYTTVKNYQVQYPFWTPPPPPTTNTNQGVDTFLTGGRGSPNAWSPASDGENWAQVVGTSTLSMQVGPPQKGQLTGSNGINTLFLGTKKFYNFEAACRFSHSNIQDRSAIILRATGNTTYYYGEYANGALNIQKSVSGSVTTIATVAVSEVAGSLYWVRFKVQGFGTWTPNLFLKWWIDGTAEPSGWMLTASDSAITGTGQFGVRGKGFANASILTFDTFTSGDPIVPLTTTANAITNDTPYGITRFVSPASGNPSIMLTQFINDLVGWGNGSWVRYQLQWQDIEQVQGQYLWSVLDDAVARCNAAGLNMCFCLQGAPTFRLTVSAATGGAGTDLPGATAMATYAAAVAARYNGTAGYGTIQALQVGNEEWDSFSPRDQQSQWLVPVVNAAYPAIRNAGFTGYVGICSVRMTPTLALTHITNWMNNLWSYQGGIGAAIAGDTKFFLDFHHYRDSSSAGPDPTTQDANTPAAATELATIISIATAHGQSPQVWCGETGWNLYDDGTCNNPANWDTQAQQSQYLQAMFDAMRLGGGKKCFAYTLDPLATVQALAACATATVYSTVPKSLVQTISAVYTYMQAYSDIQNYAQRYPIWIPAAPLPPQPTVPTLTAIGRRGTLTAIARKQ